jgi:alkylated DNA repair dioxygenase AlkB
MVCIPTSAAVIIPDAVAHAKVWLPKAEADALHQALVDETRPTWRMQLKYGRGRPYMDRGHHMSRYGEPTVTYTYRSKPKPVHPWTPTLAQVRNAVAQQLNWAPNCCVINSYTPTSGLYPHSDSKYIPQLGAQPTIVAVSFGAPRTFILHPWNGLKRSKDVVEVSLSHGDLLIMHGRCDSDFQHSIPEEPNVIGDRLSLTFRLHL